MISSVSTHWLPLMGFCVRTSISYSGWLPFMGLLCHSWVLSGATCLLVCDLSLVSAWHTIIFWSADRGGNIFFISTSIYHSTTQVYLSRSNSQRIFRFNGSVGKSLIPAWFKRVWVVTLSAARTLGQILYLSRFFKDHRGKSHFLSFSECLSSRT